MPVKRAMLFVDAQNLEQTAQHHYGKSNAVDYVELVDLLAEGYDLIRPYLFDSHAPEDDKTDFYAFLRRELGFRVVSRELQESGPTPIEKGVDVALATELLAQGYEDSYDVAVLVTGDADYDRAVRHVQDRGKIVEAAMFAGSVSGSLRDAVDDFYALNEHDERLRRE
ncbi:NYN domain-containing protein [Halarchaeum sp. P4]|uniref:LabA-like NYN domain-containing protein n=1 Tax=Halarchaeum sp. P4 TaxID=3421639 RepID=UPI003EB69A75